MQPTLLSIYSHSFIFSSSILPKSLFRLIDIIGSLILLWNERDRVQKKTFMKWVNKHLIKVRKHITDLYEDLRDGHNLISLLEVLSGVTLQLKGVSSLRRVCMSRAPPLIFLGGEEEEEGAQGPREKGRMRFHRLQNVQIALDFLKQRQVKLVNIRNDDITDGNPKLTLGLIWTIILHFQISEIYVSGESGDLTAKEKLLLWSQQASEGWPGLRCTNFSSSWSDGRMFNALLHRFRPDLIDMEVVAQQSNLDNLEQAFEIAESLGVTRLLDAEDVDVPSPDEKSVITYVSSIYDAFPKIPEGGEGIAAHEVDHRWAEYRSRFSTLLQWSRQHKAIMANKNFPLDPVELKALYNEYVHFKETEIPAKELEKSRVEHLYKLLEVWMEFGRIKLPLGLHPNDLEEEWGKLILEMLEREKALRPAVERLELLLQMANKIQNMALDCEEKLTLAKNTLQADMSLVESGEAVCCERELGLYLQDCEVLIRQLNLDLNILRDEKYYQVEQLAFRSVEGGGGELVSLRLQCSSVYRKGHFSPVTGGDRTAPRGSDSGLSLSTGAQTLLGAVGVVGVMGAALLRRPMSRSQLVAMSSSEDEGSLRFVYELLGWVEETQDVLERAEWGADLPSVEQNLQDHQNIHTAVEELLHSLKEARNYQTKVSPNFKSSYSDTLAKLEHLYCKLLELSSWRLRCLESLHAFVCRCTEELIWLNEREEEELAYDWSQNNTNVNTKRELYAEMRSELEEKQEVMHSLQETADRLCQENHPAKQTVEAYSAALQTQWQWVRQLCVCVEQHLKDNTTYFQFVSDARDCETYLRQLQDTIKRQYTCDKNSRLGKLEDLLQDSMEEKEQLIEYRSSVASLVGRAKTVVQLRPRSAESTLGSTTPIRAICDYRQIEITISRGEECVLGDNSQRTKWKVISPSGNEAMVPSVCFTVPPPNQEAMDTASRMEQLYQNVMSLWHNLHVSMKSVVSWHYLQKDIRTVSSWSLDTVRSQPPVARDQALDHLEAHLADFLSDSKESALFTPTERHELERDAHTAQEHLEKDESVSRSYLSELQNIKLRLEEAEQRLMRGIQTPPPSNRSGDGVDNTVQIAEQEKLQSDLDGLRTSLGEVSRRCGSFFEEKPASSSVPVLRSELNLAVEKIDRLHNLSSVYLHKLKTVDVLMYSLQAAESQVKRYENRLSEEDIVPVDTNAIQALREQLGSELEDQEGVFNSLQSAVQKAREAGSQLNRLHPDRSPELERYQERAAQLTERWAGVKRQMETRRGELEALGSVLQQYRDGHSALIHWIEETTERQENTQPGQTDSKVLSEQLAQQTALVADIEKNQTKLDECQTHSKQYCTSVKDYELQLMTFRAFVESTQKSTGKRRRMHSSSDTITQEFMDLRTRYTALVTLTTQHVKYISDALRRLEEEEVLYVSLFVSFSFSLLVSSTFLCVGQIYCLYRQSVSIIKRLSSRLSPEERAQVTSQMDELTATYSQLCDSSTAQLQQLVQQQAKEDQSAIGGVIDLGTMETVPVFQAARRGLIDLDTCHVLLEAQLTMGGLFQPDSPVSLSLEEGLNCGLIDSHISQSLSELESALHLVDQTEQLEGQLLPVAAAMEAGLIKEEVGLRILELQINTGGLRELGEGRLTLNSAGEMGLLTPRVYTKLGSRVNRRELIDPNTADKLNLDELQQRCILSDDTGLYLLPVKQHPGGTVCLRSGRKVGIFRAVQEGLIDRQVTVRLLEAQLFAGGISDPRSGHLLTVNEAVHHNLMDQDLACAMLTRQLQSGGILDPVTGDRLGVEEAIQTDLLSPHLALLVLESLWAFMGMLWPESGELLPIAEALQQGVISGELALNILRQRHAIGALYLPETPKVVSLNQAKEVLEPKVAEILKEIQIPDVLHNMNQSGSPKLNRLIWGSTGLNCDPSFLEKMAPEEQAHHRLLFHLMTHSYVDAHSGQRLVLLEPELVELAKAAAGLINVDPIPGVVEEGMSLTTERQECMEVVPDVSLPDTLQTREIGKVQEKSAIFSLPEKCIYSRKMGEEADNQGWDGTPDTLQANQTGIKEMGQVDLDSTMRISEEVDGGVHREVKGEKDEMVSFESAPPSAGLPEKQLITDSYEDGLVEMESEGARESGHRKAKEKDSLVEDVDSTLVEALEMYSTPVKPETLMPTQYFKEPDISPSETNEKEGVPVSVGVKYAMKDTQRVTEKTQPHVMRLEAAAVKSEEDVELERLASELQQGGLLTEGGQRLLPDEAVAQGVLPGHTAVKLMAKAGLFGGFLDVSACESLSMEDVMQEGLLDEDLMWSVLKSEKTLAGVVDVEKGKICTLKDAARAGLIDSNTAARLLEAQVVSGGVVDLRRDKKVSVTLAANLGLIEEDQREKLFTLEKSYRGKGSDPDASLTKATLQLQMNGVVDPKTKSPVPLKQALERGLLGQEEVYQALSQQVAEGGIVHHYSGVRLSVTDALQRGLVDCAISPKLWELERACQGEVALSSNPDAALLQASTGAILDPDLKCRLTLTEAVSDGLLNESIAKKAMVSPGITEGILDPESAQIVPYADLVNQGKIDIKSGKRFLEVKPFKGIQDKQTGEILNLAKAIASQQVDPVPALRMLQSQADTGGIIDISNGARLPLPKASKKGLVGEHMARLIATNQVLKGGLLDPSTGQRVSSLKKAVKDELISREMAAELQDNLGSMEVERDDEDSSTPVASSSGTYSPADTLSISSPDSQTRQPNQTKPIIIEKLRDLEPQVNKAVDAAEQLLEPRPQEVPPQLLLALEKDGRSLARVLYCTLFLCTFKCPITDLCSDSANTLLHVQLFLSSFSTFFFLPQELQSSLSARSNDVNTVAFDIQVFISERAQDLAPEQSRHLLGQLQQLQRGFHRASGQAHAKTDALAAQREREEERQRRQCSQKLEGLTMWLAGAASMLANQAGAESGDVNVLQQKQRELKEVQKDLLTRGDGVAETIRSVEEFLAEHGDSLSPEERANLQGALSRMKEQYSALTDTAQSSLVQLDTAISTTVQQNTQRAKAVEELQETRGQMDSLLEELSSLNQPGMTVTDHLSLSSSTSPEGGLQSHSDMLQAELQQLQAQQAQLMQVSQNARSLLDQPDSAVPAEEKRRLRDQLDQLQTQHQEKLRSCQERLRRSEALKDELAKFLQEHGGLGTWLEQSEGELCSLGEGETDLAEDVICHKADLRFVSISGQKVLDSVQGALEKVGGSDPALEETKQLVTDKLQDANHRYIALHTKVVTTPTLSPLPLPISEPDGLEKRFSSLSESMSERAEQLQTSVAQSVSVQEGLKGLLAWLDGLLLTPGPIQPTAQAVQDALTQNQKLRQELLSRQGSVEATCDSVSKLLQSSDASTASGLQGSLESLTQSYAAAQAKQAEREAELRGLLPKLENYERLSTDLQGFTQTCLRALSPAGQLIFPCDYSLRNYVRPLITFKHFFTKDLLSDWEAQGVRVLELNKTGSELETLIINITAPQTKTGKGNGETTVYVYLTELQVAVAEVNGRYEELGEELKDRQWRQEASLELRQKARQSTEELSRWLGDRENSLHLGQTAASPSKPEVVRAQAQENKALLSELAEHSGKVKELKSTLEKLIADNPDSPEADTWRQQMKEIDSRWEKANEAAVQRQVELETCADRLGSFATAASQLGPWLKEKELMMSVLGPLSIDPNMLNTQNQQVQFMLREFDTRRPQFDQLTQAAEGILSPSGGDSSPQDAKDLAEVRSELGSISQQWDDLTQRLSRRSEHIDQAQGTSERYQALLKNLSVNVGALGERLDSQASLSAQPEALKRRLQETGEIRSELEQRREELGEAEKLCGELSAIVVEPYLRDELKKRLESVSSPLRSLEERAADGLSQLQAALSSTQQFQQMFEELRSWLDNQSGQRDSTADSLPCQSEAIRTLLAQQDELHRGVASQRGPYELIQAEGASLLASLPAGGEERSALLSRLTDLRRDWDELNQCITERQNRLKSTLTKAESYQQHRAELTPWVAECEEREADIQLSLDPAALDEALQKARQLGLDLERRRPLLEALNIAADQLLEHCRVGEEDVRDEKAQLNRRVDGLAENLQNRVSQLEELAGRLKEFEDGRQAVERRLEAARHQIEVQDALGPQACSNKSLERLRSQQETLHSLQPQVAYLRDLAQGLVQDAPHTAGGGGEGGQRLEQQARDTDREFGDVSEKVRRCVRNLGVGEVQSSVRDLFSHLADLDDELDSLSPVGRDADSLASQADAVHAFLARLATLRSELEGHGGDCTAMLRREGSSPDLLALRRETEALSRQAGKLSERGQARMGQIEVAAEKVGEFYAKVAELQGLLRRAEEGLNAQGVVGTEVETIKQQLHEFKAVEREQVDSIQPKLQRVNAVGQGLIQSAAKHTDTQALEHDLETTNLRWNSLNKRVAERIAQLQEALLHCGKFQDALEPLLSWLSDTEELVANQKPPSAEYRVVKAQIQEQKLLQRLLDDRRATFQMIQGEGERIAATAETQDRDKIQKQLESLGERWGELLEKARARQCQLEELQTLALQFHEAVEPLGEWLSATERRLSTAEPMGTQTSKITQQITKHKAVQEAVSSRGAEVDRLQALGQSLAPLSCAADRDWLGERVGAVRLGHSELSDWCQRRAVMLEQALANAQLFGEDEVEVLNWLAEVGQRLGQVSVQSYQPGVLTQQHKHTLSLNEEIVSRKKQVDQAIKNGQALLKQTTGEEVLLIQEKLDGIKSRYAEMTGGSSKALRTLEQALQLSTRFASAHDDLNQWLDKVEAELNVMEPDATPAYQDRQKELKCVSAEKRLVLDTVNEVGNALLDLVPWRAREGLDRLVADANQRYRTAAETITQRVKLVQAAIQRSQQYEEAVDAELTWAGETDRKLSSLGPLSLEPDVTVAQLQVQRAFNIDIIRHKDTVDQLLHTRDDILETCSDQQRDALVEKTDSLSARYEAVSQQHQERFSALEQAQVLVARFWETQEDLEPWLGETETLIAQLPPPAIDTEALRLQQEQMRLLRESIAEHKPHIDKLLKIGPQLAALSHQEGATVRKRYSDAEKRYVAIKEVVKGRATTLDEAVSQSAQFHDKMDPLLETLEGAVQRLRSPPPVAAEADKIREQLADHKATGLELDKLLPSFSALCARGEELISRAAHDDPAAQGGCLKRTKIERPYCRAEEREGKLTDVLDLAGKFWADMAALLSTLRDSQDIVRELEDPGVDPSLIKQQIEAAEAIKAETDGLREELEFVRTLGADLIFACGETEKPEVKKTIDEMNAAWEGLNRTWRERMERLEEAMTASVQYQDALQSMFDYLDNAVIKLCDMSTVGTDLGTVKQQIEELKQYKVEVYQQQIDMEKLCHQGELLLKKVSDQTDRDMIQEPITELRHLWDNLGDKITHRQHKLEGALLALGQFQHALSELQSWLSHTHATLDTQRPINSDPKAIEIELAKHHVLRNDVLSHRSTVETVNTAGAELLESSPGDEANHLRDQLDHLNRGWENLLLKTQDRQKLLEAALHQAEGFHGELEEFLQWLRRTESQLSAAKPTGGLPETAREQLQQHLELQTQLAQRAEQYNRLLDAGESMLLSRGGEEGGPGAGTTQTQQNLTLLQSKWASLNTKMDDRRAKLDEAVSLATGFQSSLQDTINWLTQAEQTLNMAQPPSLILDTVLFQIDEHKVFVNEVNTHREQVLALEKAGSQLRFASIKQDVVLIKNLLLSVQARWDKLVQRSLDRGRHLDEARKRAKQFHEAWRKLSDWLEEAESRLDSELEISNEPDKIKVQLTKHKEFQKALGSKQPVYDTTVRSGKAMRDKAMLPEDTQKLDHLLGEVRDKWDTVCGKSVERQHKLEEALLFSGQFAEALQALVDWLYRVEPQLAEDLPVHGDLDLVSNLMDSHKAFQKELGKRTTSVHALKRSARELMETGRDDTAWVKVQLQELSNRWDTVCALSVTKQTRLQQALKQAEEFRTAVQLLLEWLSEAEQTLRFRGVLPEEAETLQALLHTHRNFMATVEEKRTDVNRAAGQGEAILTACQADCITTIKHWITIIRARFEEVLTWAKQHEQRLETALTELLNNATLLEELLSWLQWAETTLVQRDGETLPQDIPQLKTLITEHQVFMEEMTRKQPDVDKVTKTYKRKPAEPPSSLHQQAAMQVAGGNPRLTQLCSRWQQVWLLALDRQRKLNDALDRLEELKEFASFDFDVWRKKYMRWMNHKKSRVMDFFRRIDKDQDGKITRQEFIDGILASKFPTSRLEMTAVADIFDQDGDGYIDYYEFVAALHPNKDAYRPTTDADKIEDEVTRQVAQCKCAKRFQVEQIGENKYRFFLGNQFGDSQQLRLVRILRSTVMVRVGGGWMALDEFLVKNDPCRVQHPGLKILRSDSSSTISSRIARGRTNLELREKFILPEGASQGLAAFRSRGRRSKPGSRTASPTRSSSSASHSAHSCASLPSTPATPTASSRVSAPKPLPCRNTITRMGKGAVSGSKLKRPTFHSSRGSLTGENGGATPTSTKPGRTGKAKVLIFHSTSGAASRAGSRAGSRASSRRGSDASDASELLETRSACSDTSDTPRRPGAAKPSKIPTISKKAPSPKTPTSGKK
uniref:Microtubule actin crosslinking factor 1 n=1 Tax=Salmo trutta TaxID=8032 RepID=A0A674F4G5_SALTR